ncbi:MAG: MBL fold metallo-hydrolase [Candidatus Bipolaricaulota bacterium]|nr:MBL fold metallo-hydrolase [Candidatus Bipolaricaulota bacterium]
MATMVKQATEWTVRELKDRLDRNESFFLLDVRNREEFSAWKIEGRTKLPTLNIPYFEILEEGGKDDVVESVVAYAQAKLVSQLPKDRTILVVCAKGGTSAFVAEGLRQLGYDAVNLAGGMKAWGDFYQIKPVVESQALSIYQVIRPARGCLSYIVASQGEAAVIDPLRHIEHYLNFAKEKNLRIKLVLDTHGHADHISGGRALADRVNAPYYFHPYDAIHPIDVLPAQLSFEFLRDGQEFSVGSAKIKTIHIPGHTLGNVVYLVNEKYLMTGDSIFIESVARPDLGGRGEAWAPLHYRAFERLLKLPDSTVILPGHFSQPKEANGQGLFAATLGELKAQNEGLQMVQKGEKAFVQYMLSSLPFFPPQYVDIKRVNAGLLVPDEEKASELELGKNICALAQAYQ